MNTFHLASLALLVGLISAAPTSTYPHVDAVVPETEFPVDVDTPKLMPKYQLVTFTIDPEFGAVPLKKGFTKWITTMAEMANTCEVGTLKYAVYEGSWQVPGKHAPTNGARAYTYTFFEEYADANAFNIHNGGTIERPGPVGTAIRDWRDHRNNYGIKKKEPCLAEAEKSPEGRCPLEYKVSNPTPEMFEELLRKAKLGTLVVDPAENLLKKAKALCYPAYGNPAIYQKPKKIS